MAMNQREVICGMGGDIPWQPLLPTTGLDGLEVQGGWTRYGDTVVGDGTGLLAFGHSDWSDYELSFRARAVQGGNVQVAFRSGADGGYLLDLLLGWQAVAISKNDRRPGGRGFHKVSVVNYELAHRREYALQIAARGASITSYLDGQLVNQLTDYDFPQGRVALSVWQSKSEFRDLRYRLLQ